MNHYDIDDFISYANQVDDQTSEYTAANTALTRSMPGEVFLSNKERYIIEARIQGRNGQEDNVAATEQLYTLHEEEKDSTVIELTSELQHRGTVKLIRLKLRPETMNKAKPAETSSKSLLSLKVTSPVCLEKLQTPSNKQNEAADEAVTKILVGCPPNRELYFNVTETLQEQSLICVSSLQLFHSVRSILCTFER